MTSKEPWLAVNLSNVFPGLGQIYAGNKTKGYLMIFLVIALNFMGGYIFISPTGNILIAFGCVWILGIIIWLWSLFDAYGSVSHQNDPDFENTRQQSKDPWKAMFLSKLFFGIGHFYIGKWIFGLFAITLILMALIAPRPLSLVIVPIVVAWIAYLSYVFAPVHRETSKNLAFTIAILILLSSFIPLGLALVTRAYFMEVRWIPSGSMEPTLHGTPQQWEADKVLIDKFTYRFQDPQRGDIIVFSPTEALQKENYEDAFIKRIIGLPREKVELKDGKVYINGEKLNEDKYLSPDIITAIDVCSYSSPSPYLQSATIIPNDSYLTLGDNRPQAYDSRCWGVVERKFIIGKAFKRFWPINRTSAL